MPKFLVQSRLVLFVVGHFRSTLRTPSDLNEAMSEEIIIQTTLLRSKVLALPVGPNGNWDDNIYISHPVPATINPVFVEKVLRVQPNVKKLFLIKRANDINSAKKLLQNEVYIGMSDLFTRVFHIEGQKDAQCINSGRSRELIQVAEHSHLYSPFSHLNKPSHNHILIKNYHTAS